MNKEEFKWLLEIATPTGLSYSGDQTITIDYANKVINYIKKIQEKLDKINEICNYDIKTNNEIIKTGNDEDRMISSIIIRELENIQKIIKAE